MPKLDYEYNFDTYTNYSNLYEQYYFKETQKNKIRPLKKAVKPIKRNGIKKMVSLVVMFLMLIVVFPYSYSNFTKDVVKTGIKIKLKVDYNQLMFPTQNYLYEDLFLGKYPIKASTYDNFLMNDIPQTHERTALKSRLISLAGEFPLIQPSIYIWEYSGQSYVNINADEPYPAASIIKVPVLIEMFRNIEQGRFGLYDKMVLEDYYRAPGSGSLQYSEGGKSYTMDYLAKIMIENSDNSSTNMIMSKMGGMPQVNRAMKSWGLKTTHINNWLPDLEGTNITTAREMAKMFYNLDTTNILTNESKRHIADYMLHVKNTRLLKAGLPDNAILLHKTGDIGFMLGDAGIVKSPDGKKYIVAILVKRPYNDVQGKEFIVKASEIIYNNISY